MSFVHVMACHLFVAPRGVAPRALTDPRGPFVPPI